MKYTLDIILIFLILFELVFLFFILKEIANFKNILKKENIIYGVSGEIKEKLKKEVEKEIKKEFGIDEGFRRC